MSLSGYFSSPNNLNGSIEKRTIQSNHPVGRLLPKKATIYDCPYPLEVVNSMESEQEKAKDSHNGGHDYESIYFPPVTENVSTWQYSPLFGMNNAPCPSPYFAAPGPYYPMSACTPVDPWIHYRPHQQNPLVPNKAYSMDRLNMNTQRVTGYPYMAVGHTAGPIIYPLRSPNPSPVHTPSGSPVMTRARCSPSPGSSPALSRNAGNGRRVLPCGSPVLTQKNAASKPPRPRQRPVLQKANTIDNPYPPKSLSDGGKSFVEIPNVRGPSPQRNINPNSKIPSLDSLYEQLKAFAASPLTNPPPKVDANLAADLAALVGGVTRERSATYSGAPLSMRTQMKSEVEERLQRLEGDKDSLQMQVSILMDQIEVQTEKIHDLEKNLSDKCNQLQRAEDTLQNELLTRSSAETQKLELLSEISTLKLRYAALERENLELRGQLKRSEQDMVTLVSQCYSLCGATLGPGMNRKELIESLKQNLRSPLAAAQGRNPTTANNVDLPRKYLLPASSSSSLQSNQSQPLLTGNDSPRPIQPQSSKTPPASVFRKVESDPFSSLPRQNSSTPPSTGATPKRGVAFAETEKRLQDNSTTPLPSEQDVSDSTSPTSPHSPSLSSSSKQPRGFKKIFHKLKRANSGALEGGDSPISAISGEDFRRGGIRATAGPRLGWNGHVEIPEKTIKELEIPFSQWPSEDVCYWLHEMGLHMYVNEAQRWVTHTQVLMDASAADIEKELAIKHPLHKKKLILALEDKGRPQDPMSAIPILPELLESAGKLDHQWVVRWLDDIGLPQYKDTFLEARVDGRILHMLTIDDLCNHLRVTNILHVTCIRRGIQVLRLNNYNPACLQRRSVPEDPIDPTPQQVALWTNHRVMEWLRAVDLSEYAPNMRGSGVHGGLLVYEPRFTAELLATLLSIPQGKTLLRRHLATHFNQLLGREIVQMKREMEMSSIYVPLNPVGKVKIIKKSQFTLKRRKGKLDEFEAEDWVCPASENYGTDSEKSQTS